VNVFKSNKKVNYMAKKLSENLNLSPHIVSLDGTVLELCTDIEIHLSNFDKRIYIIDCARIFPPETVIF
jgi:hypothetical protein